MRVKDLGTRPASASLLDTLKRAVRGHAPAVPVERRQISYWQERRWTRDNNTYSGNYQTPYVAFQGWIEEEQSGHINFYLQHPSAEIRRHSHWSCFQHRGDEWYLIHMARQPKDVSSGIMTIEKLIREAYQR